jgi:hypothetical protein
MKKVQQYLFVLIAFVAGMLAMYTVKQVFAQSASPTIYACVKNSTGAIRIVPAGTKCASNETPLNWNSMGAGAPISGYQVVTKTFYANDETPDLRVPLTVYCPAGKQVLGGGFDGSSNYTWFHDSKPYTDAFAAYPPPGDPVLFYTGWTVGISNVIGPVTVFAICANVAP